MQYLKSARYDDVLVVRLSNTHTRVKIRFDYKVHRQEDDAVLALGKIGDPELAERIGLFMARELRSVGIDLNYAPVLDIDSNPGNPATMEFSLGFGNRHVVDVSGDGGRGAVRGLEC